MRVTDPIIMFVIPVGIIMVIPMIIKLVIISVIVGVHTPTPLGCGVCTLANFQVRPLRHNGCRRRRLTPPLPRAPSIATDL